MDISSLLMIKKIEDIQEKNIFDKINKIRLSLSGTLEEFRAFKKKNLYNLLIDFGIKIKYNKNKVEIMGNIEHILCSNDIENETQFELLLRDMINSEENTYLTVLYEKILNNVEISVGDIFYN